MMGTTQYKTIGSLLQAEKIRTLIAHTVFAWIRFCALQLHLKTCSVRRAQFVELVLHHGSKQPEIGTSNNALSYDLWSE